MPFDIKTQIASPTGAELNLYIRQSAVPVRAVVQVSHGLAEHAARYARFADFLASNGYHVYAHDHRGHGSTRAPDAPIGRFANKYGVDLVIGDILAVHDRIAADHPDIPVVIFSHSTGGLIALNFVLCHSDRVSAAAIWNVNFSVGIFWRLAQAILVFERFRLGSDMPSRIIPKLTCSDWVRKIHDCRTEFDWLSRDPDEIEAYVADPLCGWDASVSMWIDCFELIFNGADDRKFASVRKDMPFNLAGSQSDLTTNGGKAVKHLAQRMRRMGFSNLVFRIYSETSHESLNEVNHNIIVADLAHWLDELYFKRTATTSP